MLTYFKWLFVKVKNKGKDINIEHDFNKELSPTMINICKEILISIVGMVDQNQDLDVLNKKLLKMMRRKEGMIKKTDIIMVYRQMLHSGNIQQNDVVWGLLQKCKTRNISGVCVITLLLDPFLMDNHSAVSTTVTIVLTNRRKTAQNMICRGHTCCGSLRSSVVSETVGMLFAR